MCTVKNLDILKDVEVYKDFNVVGMGGGSLMFVNVYNRTWESVA